MTRKMKSSGIEWIGDIPEEWEVIKLKYISCFYNGFSFDSNNLVTDYIYPVIRIGDIKGDDVNFNSSLGVKDDFGLSSYLIKDNDILLAMSGATVGKVGFVEKSIKSYINQRVGIIRTSLPHFVFYNLLTKNFMEYINIRAEGSAQPNISSKMIENFSIAYPKKDLIFEITNRIKNKIRIVNDTVKLINNQIENLENYKKSVITEAVTKGLDKNVEMKDSGIEWIGEIPKHWKIIKLKLALSEKMKYGANEQGIDFSEDLPRYIRITDIEEENNLKSEGKQSLSEEKARGYILKDKTLLFARSGATVGKTFLYNEDLGRAAFAGYLISAKTDNSILLEKWLHYFTMTNSYSQWTGQVFSQSTIQNISAEKYSNMELPITNIKSQKAITEYLDEQCKLVNSVIQAKQKQLETLEDYKKSLIYEYVTGKKEVTDGEGI